MSLIDTYNVKARVAPIFVVLIPVILTLAAWAPEELSFRLGGATLILSMGFSMLIPQLGRDFGKRREPGLWESWGGPPTTQFLRHRNTTFNPILRKRYQSCLRKLRPDLKLPTVEQESKDPAAADRIYGAATRYLIGATRDAKKFPLIFNENVNYGFRRNLWGLRPFGIASAAVGLFASIIQLWFAYQNNFSPSPVTVGALVINVLLLVVWLSWITATSVRVAAEAYAERLLEACEQL